MTLQQTGSSKPRTEVAFRTAVLAGLICAFFIRLHKLGSSSLWYDETVSAYLARQTIPNIIAHTALDIHPPAYYVMLHAWSVVSTPVTGLGLEFLLAFPSLWFSVLSIALLVPIGRDLLGTAPTAVAVWIAAMHPFLVWYGQEVRMYTLAGAIGLLCLLAAIRYVRLCSRDKETRSAIRAAAWLLIYSLAAAAGLYTLYYIAFALVAINVAVLLEVILLSRHELRTGFAITGWVTAQFVVLILFGPWLPLLVRQVIEPPVPPWRTPWANITDMANDAASSLSAYIVGQSVPAIQVWLWCGLVLLLLIAYYGYTKSIGDSASSPCPGALGPPTGRSALRHWLPVYVILPLLTILSVTALSIPIYHIRYLSTYAPAFALVAAAGLVFLYGHNRVLFGLVAVVIAAGTIYSLTRFWNDPAYQSDDHRSAVAALARDWRPGDVILTNAGWDYTAVDTYWPVVIDGPYDALPQKPIEWHRLTDMLMRDDKVASGSMVAWPAQQPIGLTTGSVDGDSSLGWGSEDADFYSMSVDDTLASLQAMGDRFLRTWHYRLYDTVNDPNSVIRTWLSANLSLETEESFSGTGFLLLELNSNDGGSFQMPADTHEDIEFGPALTLSDYHLPEVVSAGTYLYLPVDFIATLASRSLDSGLATSLRLVGGESLLLAQHDEPMTLSSENPTANGPKTQILALPIPASTPPGEYDVQLIVYNTDDLRPLPATTKDGQADALQLGSVHVGLPQTKPIVRQRLTSFDYIDLVDADFGPSSLKSGQQINIDLVWLPMPSDYRDAYDTQLALVRKDGSAAATWERPLGGDTYPSSMWPGLYPVREKYAVELPEDLAEGDYRLLLGVTRASDGMPIASKVRKWWPITTLAYELGSFTVSSRRDLP